MTKRIKKNFAKRFGDPPRITITPVRPRPEERRFHNQRIFEAYKQLLTSLLKRPPTEKELFGSVDIEAALKKASAKEPSKSND